MTNHVSLSSSKMVHDIHVGLYAVILVLAVTAIMAGAYLTMRSLFEADQSVQAPAQLAPDDITPI